ncbi:MAG: hypothetical protein R3B13_10540 [Polyangiaceae bacterium]
MHHVRRIRSLLAASLAVGGVLLVVPVFAQEDPDPDQQDNACFSAVKAFNNAIGEQKDDAKQLQGNYQAMRNACADLRTCKKKCRAEKKTAKQDCSGLKGKAKRECKKEARQEKAECKDGCRAEFKTPECKGARGAFWTGLGKAVVKAVKNKDARKKGEAAVSVCKELYGG